MICLAVYFFIPSVSALLMFLMNIKTCPKRICEKLEGLISQLEDLENQQCHFDALQSNITTTDTPFSNEKNVKMIANDSDTDMDSIVDSVQVMSTGCDDGGMSCCGRNESMEDENICCRKGGNKTSDTCKEGHNNTDSSSNKINDFVKDQRITTNKETNLSQEYLYLQLNLCRELIKKELADVVKLCDDIVRQKIEYFLDNL